MLSIGLIGSGYWGKNLVRSFNSIQSVNLKYVADTSESILKGIKNQYPEVIITQSYDTIYEDHDISAVVIGTPAPTHFEIARKALLANKHVFVEKPMVLDVSHAEELVSIADERNLKLMVGHLLLYHPCVTEMKRLIDDGDIGDLYYLYCQRLNLGKVRKDENALLSFAPHDISVCLYLMDSMPVSVSARGEGYLQGDIEDVVFLNMKFENGKMANVHVSWLDPHKIRRTTVVGSKKMIVFDDMEPREKIRIYDKGVERSEEYGSYGDFLSLRDGNIIIPAVKMTEPLRIECEHFVKCVEEDLTPVSDGRNGMTVTKVLDAAQKSLKNDGNVVPISY
ncbi:Gfo/Idh/MocA family protein [Candidatus Latescibacterota bacterium]